MYIVNVYESCKKDHLSPRLYSRQHAVPTWATRIIYEYIE